MMVVVVKVVAKVAMVNMITRVEAAFNAATATNLDIISVTVVIRLAMRATKMKPSTLRLRRRTLRLMQRFWQPDWLRDRLCSRHLPTLEPLWNSFNLCNSFRPRTQLPRHWQCLALIENLGTLPQQLRLFIVEVPATRLLWLQHLEFKRRL